MGRIPRKVINALNNKTLLLLLSVLLMSKSVSAAAIDGLKNLEYIAFLVLLGAISLLVLLISFGYRLTKHRTNKVLNIAAVVLIICAFGSIAILGLTSIDPGFLATCIGLIVISILAIIFNYKAK